MSITTSAVKRGVALTCVVALAACAASLKVGSFLERGADLQRYHTFGWGQTDAWSTGDPRLDNNTFVINRIRSQVEKHLTAKGLEPTTIGAPDVLVHYHLNLSQQMDVSTIEGDVSRGERPEERRFVFEAGTLVLELVEPGTRRLLWRGWAEGSFEGLIDNQAWLEARVDSAVQRILARLPRL